MSETPNPRPDFAELYDRHYAQVRRYALLRIGDDASADDVAARVFERALDRLDGFDPRRGSPGAWLFGIARNAVADHFRARGWLAWLPFDESAECSGRADADRPARDEEHALLARALEGLDPRERELLALKFGGEMTNRAIAAQLGLGESHVGVIVHRALEKLRETMGESDERA